MSAMMYPHAEGEKRMQGESSTISAEMLWKPVACLWIAAEKAESIRVSNFETRLETGDRNEFVNPRREDNVNAPLTQFFNRSDAVICYCFGPGRTHIGARRAVAHVSS
jgi:hypothetical protein